MSPVRGATLSVRPSKTPTLLSRYVPRDLCFQVLRLHNACNLLSSWRCKPSTHSYATKALRDAGMRP